MCICACLLYTSGGLGTWFTAGYQTNKSDQIVGGIIAVLFLAFVIDMLIVLTGWLATPWERAAHPDRRLMVSPIVGGCLLYTSRCV